MGIILCPVASGAQLETVCQGHLCALAVAVRSGAGHVWVCGLVGPVPKGERVIIDNGDAGATIDVNRPGETF